jgi:hypothetical protein
MYIFVSFPEHRLRRRRGRQGRVEVGRVVGSSHKRLETTLVPSVRSQVISNFPPVCQITSLFR